MNVIPNTRDETVRHVRQRTDLTCSTAYSWAVFNFFDSLTRMITIKSNTNFKPTVLANMYMRFQK